MILTALRLLAIPVGALAYYAAFLMFPDEEGDWQSRVEKLWVTIDDKQKLTGGSGTSAFFDGVAAVATRGFNRVFGPKLFSLQVVGVSVSYSLAVAFLGLGLLFAFLFRPSRLAAPLPENLASAISIMRYVGPVLGSIFFLFGSLPALVRSRWTVALSLLPALVVTAGFLKIALSRLPVPHAIEPMEVALVASLLSDVLLVALVRLTIRRLSPRPTVARVSIAVFLQAAVVLLLVVAPFHGGALLQVRFGKRPELEALVYLGILSAFTGLASFRVSADAAFRSC